MTKKNLTAATPKPLLNKEQQLFVREYLKDLNATQAVMRSYGMKQSSAQAKGSRLLSNLKVAQEIQKEFSKRTEKVEIDVEMVLKGLKDFAMANPKDAYEEDGTLKSIHDMPESLQKSISSLEVDEIWEFQGNGKEKRKTKIGETKKIRFWDKAKGLELLGKYLAMFIDRQRLEDPNGQPLPAVEVHVHRHIAHTQPTSEIPTQQIDLQIRPEVQSNV